jgi:DNA modification methylase
LIAAFTDSGFEFRWGLVWVKDQIVLSRADYHFQHENILYGWKPDGAHHWHGDRKQSSCMFVDRPKSSEEHPTMKPIELVEIMLKNNSEIDDVVLEPFSGSGTTLIACERLNRKCRAVEISPAYVAVAIQRWVDVTGGEPVLVE